MTTAAVTGPRELTPAQAQQARQILTDLMRGWEITHLHVGDASGLDAIALDVAHTCQVKPTLHEAEGRQAWQLQKRSRAMVDALTQAGGTLHAFPNKSCPTGLTVASWKGSGTWGTVRYAVSKGLKVELHPLTDEAGELPDWMEQKQLSLM